MHQKSSLFPKSSSKTAMFRAPCQHNHRCADDLSQKCLSRRHDLLIGRFKQYHGQAKKCTWKALFSLKRHNLVSSKQSAGESHLAQNMHASHTSLSKDIRRNKLLEEMKKQLTVNAFEISCNHEIIMGTYTQHMNMLHEI